MVLLGEADKPTLSCIWKRKELSGKDIRGKELGMKACPYYYNQDRDQRIDQQRMTGLEGTPVNTGSPAGQ